MTMLAYILYPVCKLGVKNVLQKEGVKMQTAFNHLRIGFRDTLEFHKIQEVLAI
jgi:hypothetical protein